MQEPSKLCLHCGQTNNLSAQFCQRCGARFRDESQSPLTPQSQRRPESLRFLLFLGVAFFGLMLFGWIFKALQPGERTPSENAALAASPTPTPVPTPALSPGEHMAAAKKLLSPPHNKAIDAYEAAMRHLNAISPSAKEYEESTRLYDIANKEFTRREAALARERAANDPKNQLVVVRSNWEKGGFGAVAIWHVTFKNNSDQPIGDIQYRTVYFSETGNQVDKGGVDSILGTKLVQKVVPAKSTRTIEINDGFTHSEAHRARFELVEWRFVADSR